jgi:hypothetical protein
MKKLNWQIAYENWMDERTESELSKRNVFDAEMDKQLNEWLPDEVFEEIYNKMAALEALHEEESFQAGFKAGMLAAIEAIRINSNAEKAEKAEATE